MHAILVAITLALCTAFAGAQAQTYPSRTITIIVPFPPGGSTDTVARIMAERMQPLLGQPVIIENVGGAGGSTAVGRVARAEPDGYTIDIGQWDTHVGSIIYKLNYDLEKDFAPIGLISVNPQLLVAKKSLAASNLKELVEWMKANPGKALFVNQNAAAKVSGILLQQATGTQVQFVPYRGAGPAMTDLISGQVDLLVVQAAVALPQVQGGNHQGDCQPLTTPLARTARHSHLGRERSAGPLHVGLVRVLWPEGDAEATSWPSLTARWCRHWPIRPFRRVSRNWVWMLRPATSKRRRDWPPSTRPKSRNGGRSSSLPASRPSRTSRRPIAALADPCTGFPPPRE